MAIHEVHSRQTMDADLARERDEEAVRAAALVVHVRALEDQHERVGRAAEQFLALAGELAVAPQALEHRPAFDHAAHRHVSRKRSLVPPDGTAGHLTGWTVRRPVYVPRAGGGDRPQAGIWVLTDGRVIVGMTPTPKSALTRMTGCAVRDGSDDLVRTGAGNGIVAPGEASRVARIEAATDVVIDALRDWIRVESARATPHWHGRV
jgi:hypothetical protein